MFKKGDTVDWSSQSGGYEAVKSGQVVAIVNPGQTVQDALGVKDIQELAGTYSVGTMALPGGPRDHESYVVAVPGKTERAKPKLYWPRSNALRGMKTKQAEGNSAIRS